MMTGLSSMLVKVPTGDITAVLNNVKNYFGTPVDALISLLGLAMVAYGAVMVFRAVTGRTGSTGPHWLRAILAIVVGSGFMLTEHLRMQAENQTQDTVQRAINGGTVMTSAKASVSHVVVPMVHVNHVAK